MQTHIRPALAAVAAGAAFAAALVVLPAPAGIAQPSSPAAEYRLLSSSEDVASADWLALAERARQAGDLVTAGRALDMAESGLSPARAGLERARIAAVGGDSASAIAVLERLFDEGFSAVRAITADPVLAGLEGRGGYDALIEKMSRRAYPCRYDDAFREFDFWLGDWDVHLPDGQYAGSNTISRDEAGCVLNENWVDARGGTGSSINYVDKRTGEWVQVWNSESGTQIAVRGGLETGGMRLEGEIHYVASGTTASFRGLWTPLDDGRVRQFFEQSSDGGETWTPWFEGYYSRKARLDEGVTQ